MNTITIVISETEETRRFMRSVWKGGRAIEQPNMAKQVFNMEADIEDETDAAMMHDSFVRWTWEGIRIMNEYIAAEPSFSEAVPDKNVTITLQLPENWLIHSAPGMKYALKELIHNGMVSDWYDDTRPDAAKVYRQKAEVNKAELQSIIYSLNAPII